MRFSSLREWQLSEGKVAMPPLQYWFTGGALAAFLVVATAGYAWYRAAVNEQESTSKHAQSEAQRLKTEQVKNLLGRALANGEKLIREQVDKEADHAEADAEAWGTNARDMIAAAYGDGEAALFLDSSGYIFYGDGSAKSKTRTWIDGRMRRITELVRRTDSLTVRSDFEPEKFD
jgi:hypothetical protein